MKKLLQFTVKATLKIEEAIMASINAIISIIIFASAVMRYAIHLDFRGLTELITILVAWLYFTSNAYVTYHESHINATIIDAFVKSERAKTVVNLIRNVISIVFYVIFVKLSVDTVVFMLQTNPRTPMLRIPSVITYIPIVLCFFLNTCYSVILIRRYLRQLLTIMSPYPVTRV